MMGKLTEHVRDALQAQITQGVLPPGAQLPTERELSSEFGVSRVTVRRALAALTEAGLIHSVQGRGTFVMPGVLAEPPNALLSFHSIAANDNVHVGARVLTLEVRPATIREAERFSIVAGVDLFILERLRTLDALPVAIDCNVLPLSLAPALPDVDWTTESLYSRLVATGHGPAQADYSVEARAADDRAAQLLATSPGAPLLVAESDVYDQHGRLIVAGHISYRGDRYRFRSTLTAQHRSNSHPSLW